MVIKFMSFNIQHGKDFINQVIDLDLMVDMIKKCQAEIIGLNEVFGESVMKQVRQRLLRGSWVILFILAKPLIIKEDRMAMLLFLNINLRVVKLS